MLAYFFALRYITKLYKCQKRQFCLGSITKCDVIRTGGGFQRWGVAWCFVFWLLGASANYPKRFARGGRNKRRQPCKS